MFEMTSSLHGSGTSPPPPPGPARRTVGARTGGRSERVVTAVLEATVAELARTGYVALRLEDVASHAGVNKTTVYRRWPTKEELVVAALREHAGTDEKLPDTGALRTDLVALVKRTLSRLRTPRGSAISRMINLELANPEVDRVTRKLRDEVTTRRAELIRRAQSRGEIAVDVDESLVLDAIFAPIMTRAMKLREHVDDATIERLVDLVVRGVESGGGRKKR